MAALSILVPDVRVEIPDIPTFVAERAILRATREFADETRTWRENIQITTDADTATIDIGLIIPTGTEMVDIISMKNIAGGQPVEPRTFVWLDENASDWRADSDLNAKWYVLESANVIRLIPTPANTVANQYYVRVAVKPLLNATTIGDVLCTRYHELLVHGALSKLFMIPRKVWTDSQLAVYHQTMFRAGFAGARSEAADEFQTGIPRKVKYGGI